MEKNIIVKKSESISKEYEERYVVINNETGEILDDAQGYGYKTKQKAYAAYAYKNRDRSKDKEKKQREEYIRKWMKEHKGFIRFMDQIAFEIAKGSWGPDDVFDAKLLRQMMKDKEIETDITPSELLRVWRKR